MVKKNETNNQPVTQKEFVETKYEFREQFEQIDKRFEQVDLRFEKIENRLGKMDNTLERHSIMLIKLDNDMKRMENNTATKDDVRKIITTIDNYAGKTQDYEHKSILNTHRLEIVEPKIEDHEKRISSLESVVVK